jgi:hypothetical protein
VAFFASRASMRMAKLAISVDMSLTYCAKIKFFLRLLTFLLNLVMLVIGASEPPLTADTAPVRLSGFFMPIVFQFFGISESLRSMSGVG